MRDHERPDPLPIGTMISAAQYDFERGFIEGWRRGWLEGWIQASREGCDVGLREDRIKSWLDGGNEGLRISITKLLTQRFGPLDDATKTWITQAEVARLERAFAQLPTAPSLTTILADE